MIELIKSTDGEMLLRLLLATILGLTLGIERELKRKALGLKTILVISIVSCLLTIVSIQSAYTFTNYGSVEIRMDPLRLAAQIVSGVGFLGAGVILRRGDETITGLTTAAVVWGAAGIGIATGAGFYIEAIIGVILLLVSIELIPYLIKEFGMSKIYLREVTIRLMLRDRAYLEDVIEKIKAKSIAVDHYKIKDLSDESCMVIVNVALHEKQEIYDFYHYLSSVEHIDNVTLKVV